MVDDVFGTQPRYEREISCGGGRRHVGTQEAGQLHGEDAHGTGAAMHEDALSGTKFRAIDQPLPRGQRSNGNGGRLSPLRS